MDLPDDELPNELILFISDASAEAERLTLALGAQGYVVIDVPLSLLAHRVAVQRPALVLCDADAEGVLQGLTKIATETEGDPVPVILLGRRGGVMESIDGALAAAVFARPVNVRELSDTIERLVGAPPAGPKSLPPPSRRLGGSSHPPTKSLRPDAAAAVPLPPDLAGDPLPRENGEGPALELSAEIKATLADAERRWDAVRPEPSPDREEPGPEADVETALAGDVLSALDEPLDEDESDEEDAEHQTAAGGTVSGGRSAARGHTHGGTTGTTGAGTTGLDRRDSRLPPRPAVPSEPPKDPPGTEAGEKRAARQQASTPKPPRQGGDDTRATGVGEPERRFSMPPATVAEPVVFAPSRGAAPPAPSRGDRPSEPPRSADPPATQSPLGSDFEVPKVLREADALTLVARAIRARFTGALRFEVDEGIRRLVFRDGDFVTAASAVHGESLVLFLAGRGDLPPEIAKQAHKLPSFGRRAGAALIAQGHLAQEALWTVLRAHAEWLIGRIFRIDRGTAAVETGVTDRLRDEPAVFGGATGAEVFIEVVRRILPEDEGLSRLGGPNAVLEAGPSRALLDECALSVFEADRAAHANGRTVSEIVEGAPDPSFASALWGLVALSVLTLGARESPAAPEASSEADSIDEDARRERILARKSLVDEADYFAVLGLSRDATSYDVKRAYAALRRDFEPSRVLTPGTADLAEVVDEIVEVLDEAYEVLGDGRRRERYRKAILATP